MKRQQRFLDRLRDKFPDFKFAVKFHLALGRMDVHVHRRGINFQKQAADRITAFHQRRVVTFEQRVVEPAIFDRAPVDEQMLALARRARHTRRTDETPDPEVGGRRSEIGFRRLRGFKNIGFFRFERIVEGGREVHGQKFFVAEQGAETLAQRLQPARGGRAGMGSAPAIARRAARLSGT